jgi:hypothetical protein
MWAIGRLPGFRASGLPGFRASGLTDVALHQLIPPFTVDAQIIAKVADTTTIHSPTAAAL